MVNKLNQMNITTKKGEFGGGILMGVLFFVVIVVFISLASVTLTDISQQTTQLGNDTAYNATQSALTSMQTFSDLTPVLMWVLIGGVFMALIMKFIK